MTTLSEPVLESSLLHGDASLIDQLADEWEALCDRIPHAYYTFRPATARIFLKVYATGANCHAITVRSGTKLVGLAVFVEQRLGVGPLAFRRMRLCGNYATWETDFLVDPEFAETVPAIIERTLMQWRGWDAVTSEVTRDDGYFRSFIDRHAGLDLTFRMHSPMEDWVIQCPPPNSSVDETLATIPVARKRQFRRHLKKAQEMGELRWSVITPDAPMEELEAALELFVEVEASGWKGAGGQSLKDSPKLLQYAQEHMRTRSMYFHTLRIGDRVVVTNMGTKSGDRFYDWLIAVNEEFSAISPGHLMTAFLLSDMANRGCTHMDCMGSHEGEVTYKSSWSAGPGKVSAVGAFRSTIRGRAFGLVWTRMWPLAFKLQNRLQGVKHKPAAISTEVDPELRCADSQ